MILEEMKVGLPGKQRQIMHANINDVDFHMLISIEKPLF